MKMSNTQRRELRFNSAYLKSMSPTEASTVIRNWPSIVAADSPGEAYDGTGPIEYFRDRVDNNEDEESRLEHLSYIVAMLGASARLAAEILTEDSLPETPEDFDTVMQVAELAKVWRNIETTLNTVYELRQDEIPANVDRLSTALGLAQDTTPMQEAIDSFPLDGIDAVRDTLLAHEDSSPVISLVLYPWAMLSIAVRAVSLTTLTTLRNQIGDL